MLSQMSPRERFGYFAIIAVVLFVFGSVGRRYLDGPAPLVIEQSPVLSAAAGPSSSAAAGGGEVVVHVAGAVKTPGVLTFPPGARVKDAIERAGGAVNADLEGLNLAARLEDGTQLYVPRKGVEPVAESASTKAYAGRNGAGSYNTRPAPASRSKPTAPAPGSISLNSASAGELDRLPGVGPATAAKILEYRRAKGGFTSIEEVLAVKGIGPKKLAAMRKFLRL